eukprot:195245_1
MFPNVKEVFLRDTVLNLRICYRLVKFDKEYGDKSKLERIFFNNNAKCHEAIRHGYVMRFKLVLGQSNVTLDDLGSVNIAGLYGTLLNHNAHADLVTMNIVQ